MHQLGRMLGFEGLQYPAFALQQITESLKPDAERLNFGMSLSCVLRQFLGQILCHVVRQFT